MKIAFISDIHGNAVALDAVLRDIAACRADRIVVLGDLCYRGPEPKRALDAIRALGADVIGGNADAWTVRGVRAGEVPDAVLERMNAERDWIVSQLEPDDLRYLEQLPRDWTYAGEAGTAIHAFHATPDSLFEIVPPDAAAETIAAKLTHRREAQLYLYAHIHLPYVRYVNGRCIANLGSVGLPFDGLAQASYALVELAGGGPAVTIRRVNYDVEQTAALYREKEYPNAEQMSRIVRGGRFS